MEPTEDYKMNKAISLLLLALAACATNQPAEDTENRSSGPTVYGELSVSLDHISAD